MRHFAMSLFFITTGLLGHIVGGPASGIPSRQEQADLLKNVEEVFNQVRVMVDDEGRLTDKAAIADLEKLIKREQDKLCLVEELALLKLSCHSSPNSVCKIDFKPKIQRTIQEGHAALDMCIKQARENVTSSSTRVFNMTSIATARGQSLLDTLSDCSKKTGLQQISCYRRVMLTDVTPVKKLLLDAINTHKDCHEKVISIKEMTNGCVDYVMAKYQAKTAQILADSMECK